MNIKLESVVSGKIDWLEIRRKDGTLKARVENVPNLITQGLGTLGDIRSPDTPHYAMTSTAESYEDLDGTWNQSGNTLTRATGTGTFPSSPSQIDNELYWYDAGGNTGVRVHVTARASDTSITVSGPARTITGGKLRRFLVNSAAMSTTGSSQVSATVTRVGSTTYDDAAGSRSRTYQVNFASAASPYTLGSFIMSAFARVKLPATIAIDAEDQIQYQYTVIDTHTGRSQDYDIGAESTGIPQKHSMLSIVGNGTNVDVTFSAATHFLAGDKLDLRGVTTKKFAISSASSTSTTFTINTATAHSLNPGDSVTIEGASVGPYNGVFTVATTATGTQFTILDASNPGAMGASGTARLTTPGTYFDDLGLATIASMVSSSVARITSAITGPDVEPVPIGGDPGVKVRFYRGGSESSFGLKDFSSGSPYSSYFTEANTKAVIDVSAGPTTPSTTSSSYSFDTVTPTSGAAANDWTYSQLVTKNAGTGTDLTRMKQLNFRGTSTSACFVQITFNTPFNKTTAQRLRVTCSKQIKRTLDLTGLP